MERDERRSFRCPTSQQLPNPSSSISSFNKNLNSHFLRSPSLFLPHKLTFCFFQSLTLKIRPFFSPKMPIPLLLLLFFSLLPSSFSQQSCTNDIMPENKLYSLCNSLPQLSANLHWTYHPSNSTVDIAYRAPQSSDGWIGWALNPTSTGMNGAETIFAFHDSNGIMTTVTYPVTYQNTTVRNSSLSFKIYSMSSAFSNDMMSIYATIELPNNRTKVNHVWQESTIFTNGMPSGHATSGANVLSTGTLDLLSGEASGSGNSRLHRKNTHGVLTAVSWGILMPIGAIIARYMRVFKSADPAWFYLHVACQCSAYIVGVAGWGTGLKLGSDSKGITHDSHRNIGITLFSLATLQVFALLLRPKKDHKYRLYWNIYHHVIGYTVIILSVINIFKGFDILDPEKKWKHAYIAIIATLGGIAVVLEVLTWGIVLKRKRSGNSDKSHRDANGVNGLNGANGVNGLNGANGVNGLNGTNGYGGRQHQVV